MAAADRYREALRNIPAPGTGCHPALLSAARLGAFAGEPPAAVASAIAAAVPPGKRRVTDGEIRDAVNKAFSDKGSVGGWRATPRLSNLTATSPATLRSQFIARGGGRVDLVDLWECSPVRIDWQPWEDAPQLLRALYCPDELLFIGHGREYGDQQRACIRSAWDWVTALEKHTTTGGFRPEGLAGPHIIPNPLSGSVGKTQDGKDTYRGDSCVASFRIATGEFDEMNKPTQAAFWRGLGVPLYAVIDSGGKSLHAWLKVDIEGGADAWTARVEGRLFGQVLVPMGVDSACKNESRLSRLPGHYRTEKSAWQRLLWLNPDGGPIK